MTLDMASSLLGQFYYRSNDCRLDYRCRKRPLGSGSRAGTIISFTKREKSGPATGSGLTDARLVAFFLIPSKLVAFMESSIRMKSVPARKSSRIFCLWFALFLVANPLPAQPSAVQPPPTIVFMTDFGVVDDSVALCKGVMYGITPSLRIVDLTHQVNAFSIRDGARFLFG